MTPLIRERARTQTARDHIVNHLPDNSDDTRTAVIEWLQHSRRAIEDTAGKQACG